MLIVDDDSAILAHLSALLTPWGLEVITLTEPEQFWEMLLTNLPDLLILDMEMPQVSGLDLCQVVRQDTQWGDLPILVVTAHTDADSLQQAFTAGADDFITKPVLGARTGDARTHPDRSHWLAQRAVGRVFCRFPMRFTSPAPLLKGGARASKSTPTPLEKGDGREIGI